jgi:vitellogenic carboxypeptidase-like protein
MRILASVYRSSYLLSAVSILCANCNVLVHLLIRFHSIETLLPNLFENYRVLIYSGQFDIILSAPACQDFLNSLQWQSSKQWQTANKLVWKVHQNDSAPAGYVQQYNDFHYVIVREAGHLLPQDQPVRAFDMITRFINKVDWTN